MESIKDGYLTLASLPRWRRLSHIESSQFFDGGQGSTIPTIVNKLFDAPLELLLGTHLGACLLGGVPSHRAIAGQHVIFWLSRPPRFR